MNLSPNNLFVRATVVLSFITYETELTSKNIYEVERLDNQNFELEVNFESIFSRTVQ